MEKLSKSKFFFNKIYHIIFGERFNKKINYNFPKNISRIDLIKKLIAKNDYQSYLEIGCDSDVLFNSINTKVKIGVDPVSGGNYKGTSDDFFASNISKFDCIFIDGLHEYEQVKKDIKNSISCLSNNGAILLHDCLPVSYAAQAVPRYKSSWNGDVWKAIVEVRTWGEVDVKTVLIDHGVSIIKKRKNTNLLKLSHNKFSNLKFKDFYHNYFNYLQIIDYKNIDNYY